MSFSISTLYQAHHSVLNLVASCTGCAIGVYEPSSDGNVREVLPPGGFESYCSKIQSFPEGRCLCHADHIKRAKKVIETGIGCLTLCHAGVFNQALPIVIKGRVRAVLMYGQMCVEGDDHC